MKRLLMVFACLLTACAALAQAAASGGKVIEDSQWSAQDLPEYGALPVWAQKHFSAQSYKAWVNDSRLKMSSITYLSDGLNVRGVVASPSDSSRDHPVVLWNHGSEGE